MSACLRLFTPFLLLAPAFPQCVPLTGASPSYQQEFDTLASSGLSNTALPAGWLLAESGASSRNNQDYAADDGSSNAGDVYSYGAASSSERAFGTLRSGTLSPTLGACFTNRTGAVITALTIAYRGEQWRLGAPGRADRLSFQYSLSATSLTTGSWTSVPALDFATPNPGAPAGASNGNEPPQQSMIGPVTIPRLRIPDGVSFYLRWVDEDPPGADDGLAIDGFRLSAATSADPSLLLPRLSLSDASVLEGAAGTTTTVTVTLTLDGPAPATGVTFDLTTSDGTAQSGVDYLPLRQVGARIEPGDASHAVALTILGDDEVEPDETFTLTVSNLAGATLAGSPSATITIRTDDFARLPISQIQGAGATSPFTGQTVITNGIVTAVVSNGFFLQSTPSGADGDPRTSEGLFVFTGAPGAKPNRADLVEVTGLVVEFSADTLPPTLTELTNPAWRVLASAQPLPQPEPLTAADLDPVQDCSGRNRLDALERLEGMRVRVPDLRVVAPTSSAGVLYAVLPESTPRPLREPGVECNSFPPDLDLPGEVPVFDSNPEVLGLDLDRQTGTRTVAATVGQIIAAHTGVLDFVNRTYTLAPDGNVTVSGAPYQTPPLRQPEPREFTTATMNLARFGNQPAVIAKIARVIRERLHSPDLVAVQEVTSPANLEAIAAALRAAGVPYEAYAPSPSNDAIANGVLINTSRLRLRRQPYLIGVEDRVTGTGVTLNDRPPLIVEVTVNGQNGASLDVTAAVLHQRSLIGVETESLVREKRRQQTDFFAAWLQTRIQDNVIVLCDCNAFPFTDGYVDVMGGLTGQPGPALLPTAARIDPGMENLIFRAGEPDRWTYLFRGDAQALDHILASPSMSLRVSGFAVLHNNAPYPDAWQDLFDRAERISDHDHPMAYWWLSGPSLSGSSH